MSISLLWEITLGSWLTAFLILLARVLFRRKLSSRAKYLLWFLLILRLLPIPLRSPTSLLAFMPESLGAEAAMARLREPAPAAEAAESPAVPGEAGSSGTGEAGAAPDAERTLRLIWALGAGAALLVQLVLYASAARRLRSLPPCRDPETARVYLELRQRCLPGFSPRLVMGSAGMLGGLLHPALVLPPDRLGQEAAPILLHELMHYRGRDLWVELLLRLLCTLSWFNPVAWLCLRQLRRDAELACDQRVLDTRVLSPKAYAQALYEEWELRGEADPLPMASFQGSSLTARLRGIRDYRLEGGRRGGALPAALALLILLAAVCSPGQIRRYGIDRSIPAQTGYPDAESYIADLQSVYGAFGMTYAQLAEAGYLTEGEGIWLETRPEKAVLSVSRDMEGRAQTLLLVFRPTLFTADAGIRVLTEIQAPTPSRSETAQEDNDYDDDWLFRAIGRGLLTSSPALNDLHAVYSGMYNELLTPDARLYWGILDWMESPEERAAHYTLMLSIKYKRYYDVRCSPVTLGDCLSPEDAETLAALAVEAGMAPDLEEGRDLVQCWHLCGLLDSNVGHCWRLIGMGIALYMTRPEGGAASPQ